MASGPRRWLDRLSLSQRFLLALARQLGHVPQPRRREARPRRQVEEQRERYAKYDDSGNNLEPNIKEGPGGLRDIQTIGWVAKRHFVVSTMRALVDHGFLTDREYHKLRHGAEHLWRVRYGLHLLTGRHEDRLLFDFQRQAAELFGYEGDPMRLLFESGLAPTHAFSIRLLSIWGILDAQIHQQDASHRLHHHSAGRTHGLPPLLAGGRR